MILCVWAVLGTNNNALVTLTATIRLRFDGRSTGVLLPIKGHYGHSDVAR